MLFVLLLLVLLLLLLLLLLVVVLLLLLQASSQTRSQAAKPSDQAARQLGNQTAKWRRKGGRERR